MSLGENAGVTKYVALQVTNEKSLDNRIEYLIRETTRACRIRSEALKP